MPFESVSTVFDQEICLRSPSFPSPVIFIIAARLATPKPLEHRLHSIDFIGKHEQVPYISAHHLFGRVAGRLFTGAIESQNPPLPIQHDNKRPGSLQHGIDEVTLFLECLLRQFSFADIHDRRQDPQPIPRPNRIEADLQPKLLSIFSHTIEIPSFSHGTKFGMGEEFFPVAGVLRPDALRHEHFNRLPDQFSPFIAEQLLNLPIHQEDGTPLIHHQHPVRGRFDHETKLLPARLCSVRSRTIAAKPVGFPSPPFTANTVMDTGTWEPFFRR